MVYPAWESPKKMGPPEEVAEGVLVCRPVGEVGEEGELDGGRVSQESVRRQDCRIMEKERGWSGSWVDV